MPLPQGGLDKDEFSKAEVEELIRKSDDELNDKVEKAGLVAEMSDAERTHYKSLTGETQEAFLFMDTVEKAAALKAAETDDPIMHVMKDGTEVRESAGEFAINLAKRQDALLADTARLIKSAEDDRLSKLVNDGGPYVNLKGDEATRIAMVKSAESIEDESMRKNVLESLKAKSTELGGALTTAGTSAGGTRVGAGLQKALTGGDAHQQLEEIAKGLREADTSLNSVDAYAKAGELNPALYESAIGE